MAQARQLGSRPIDFAFDSNWGYLVVKKLNIDPTCTECEVLDHDTLRKVHSTIDCKGDVVHVRLKEMSLGHVGIPIPRATLQRLSKKCPRLQGRSDTEFAAEDGPLTAIPFEVFRVLLFWAETGRLLFERRNTKVLSLALKACGAREVARKVRQVGFDMPNAGTVAKRKLGPVATPGREPKARNISVASSKRRKGEQPWM